MITKRFFNSDSITIHNVIMAKQKAYFTKATGKNQGEWYFDGKNIWQKIGESWSRFGDQTPSNILNTTGVSLQEFWTAMDFYAQGCQDRNVPGLEFPTTIA